MKKLFENNRKEIINIKAVGTMLGFMSLVVAGMLLGVDVVYADDTYVSTATITIPSSCSITSTLDTPHTATIPAGIYSGNYNSDGHNYTNGIGQTTIKAFCNDSGGFSIYAIGYTNDTYGNTNLVGPDDNNIVTGTATSGSTSNWAMKIGAVSGTYTPTITGTYGNYSAVPTTYDKVATFGAVTDLTNGASITTTYAAYIASNQAPGTYNGKVKYTLVHPASETPLQPQTTQAGQICYYPNGSNVEGTMGCQTITASATSATLLASNFSRDGYGFAGWSKTFDYSDSTGFLGPQEYITFTAGEYSGDNNGLSLYAHWIKSEGNLQNWTCPDNTTMPIGTVKALTDQRDNETYAIAKLADGNCWMIENLRLESRDTVGQNRFNSSITNESLAQGYGTSTTYGNFSGLADAESTNFSNSTTANSLYYSGTQSGDATIDIGTTNYPGYRMPRYNNWNNQSTSANRPQNPTSNSDTNATTNAGMYSYGNYYTWHAAIADLTYNGTNNNSTTSTSLCPTGWRLPQGGDKTRIESNDDNDFWNLAVDALNGGVNPANYDSQTRPYYTGTAEAGPVADKLRSYPNNFLYSGYFSTSSAYNRGSYGGYWSSTASSSDNSYRLYLYSSNVYPGTGSNNKRYGCSIRCTVSAGT